MRALPLLLLLFLVPACAVRRTLEVTTDPPGATVRIGDDIVGTTPIKIPFEHYGTRRVTIYRDGYRTHSERVKLRTPWYSVFPLDLVSEVLLPFGWKDRRHLHVTLVPGEKAVLLPSLTSVLARADILRSAGPEGPRDLPPPEATLLPAAPEAPAPEPPEPESTEPGSTEPGPLPPERGRP